jgi:GntR family transcriptional regulator
MSSQPETSGSDGFEVTIDRDGEVPMGVQLGWALCASIQGGGFKPGERLPALREMAETTGLNINTVRVVYQRLEQKGLIQSQQGSGTFVASTPPPRSELARIASEAAREAHETGVDPRDVAAALYVSGESAAAPTDPAVARRQMLRTQIAVLERAIGEIEAGHTDLLPASTASRRGPGPMLLGAGELEQVRTQLIRRLAVVQGAIDGHDGVVGLTGASEPDVVTREAAVTGRGRTKRDAPKASKRKASKRSTQPRGGARPAPAGT